jgi:NAD(P)-dependent dehydrogenase (short-subunit alcohol dehydrogenase family)
MTAGNISFDGKVVVVTGGGRGLGRAYALEFARRGARVLVNDLGCTSAQDEPLRYVADEVVDEIRESGGAAVANYESVADLAGARKIIEAATDAFGTVDVLVNNAGIAAGGLFHEVTMEQLKSVIDCHLMGSLAVTHAAWAIMRAKGYGRIVMTISTAGLFGLAGMSGYCAGKGGVFGLTKGLAREAEGCGIRVNAIAPGAKTRMTAAQFGNKAGYTWRPELVVPAVMYLASEQCRHNGVVVAAAAGKFSRAEAVQSGGVQFDPRQDLRAEAFAERVEEITALTDMEALSDGLAAQVLAAGNLTDLARSSPG